MVTRAGAEVVNLASYAQEGLIPAESLLTVYRHPGPCGFGGALNQGSWQRRRPNSS